MSSSQAETQSTCPSSGPPRIRQLPENVVNKIAAGEVIQRPFNAVKELIENSLDAGSTLIQIILREGGLRLIQVQDNGHGIQPDDLPILCERFTTSKLKSFEDLSHLATFGFRGEALSSLSYVSRLTVTTRPADQSFACKVDYREGKPLAAARPCAGNPGTNITAEDLFFNVPVRRGALRSPREEFARVSEVVSKYSLHFSGKCGFFLRSLDKRSGTPGPVGTSGDFRTAADWSRQDVVRALFGQRTADDLLPVTSCQSFNAEPTRLAIQQLGLRFDALLTNPNKITSGGLPSVQLVLFVNDRLIECPAIKHAIEAAYAAILPQHVDSLYSSTKVEPSGTRSSSNFSVLNLRASSLFVYLGLQLPPDTLDVNVHPTKAEVHFLHEDAIIAGLREAFIQSLLTSSGSRNVLMRSLRLSPDKPSPKITRLELPSKASARASPTPAASRPQDMVRTDVRTQRLEAFLPGLHGGSLQTPVSFVDLTLKRSPSPDIESDSEELPSSRIASRNTAAMEDPSCTCEVSEFLSESASLKQQTSVAASGPSVLSSSRPTGRRPVLLASVIAMRTKIEAAASSDAQGLLRECVFVGCVSRAHCLVQQSTNLLLMRIPPLARELFYQLMVANFANHGEMILSNPAPAAALLEIGISVVSPESTPAQTSQLVEKGVKILRKRADMLWDYFSMKLSPGEDGELLLRSLPLLLYRFIPDLRQLPLYLLRLVQDVDWNEEAACFEAICRLTADFYARRTEDSHHSDVKKDSEDADACCTSDEEVVAMEEDEKENVTPPPASDRRRLKLPWQWTVENVLLPAFRTVLLPSRSLCFHEGSAPSPALLKLTSLNDLYKVFERC